MEYHLWLGPVHAGTDAKTPKEARKARAAFARFMGVRPFDIRVEEREGFEWRFWPRRSRPVTR